MGRERRGIREKRKGLVGSEKMESNEKIEGGKLLQTWHDWLQVKCQLC